MKDPVDMLELRTGPSVALRKVHGGGASAEPDGGSYPLFMLFLIDTPDAS